MSTNLSFTHPGILENASIKLADGFDEHTVLHDLKHYLPAQAPLKDFIHHNTLHAFQNRKFHEAIRHASAKFGYMVSLSLNEYRAAYHSGRITPLMLERAIIARKGDKNVAQWVE